MIPYNRLISSKTRNSKYWLVLRAVLGLDLISSEQAILAALAFVNRNKLEGNYLEFGVAGGKTIAFAYHTAQHKPFTKKMHFYGFDSFEGMPEASKEDKTESLPPGKFAESVSKVGNRLLSSGVKRNKITLVKGWFDKVLPKYNYKDKVAIIHIDCDFYESTVPCLDFLTPLVQDGTVIIFNDWFMYNGREDMGEQKAFYQWLKKNKNITTTDFGMYKGKVKAFILHKK